MPFFIEKTSSAFGRWLFFFRYLNRLKDLPEELDESKFKQLTESSKVSNLSKKEFEAYRNMYHKVWDHNALRHGFFKEFADDVNAKIEERISDRNRKIAKRMILDNLLSYGKIAEGYVAKAVLFREDPYQIRNAGELKESIVKVLRD